MTLITIIYILNALLLILHEIESAFEKEWEILKLPGGISGFLLMHVPVVLLVFYGLIEIEKNSTAGLVIGLVTGAGGLIPFIVHKVIVKENGCFNRLISNFIIYINLVTGIFLMLASLNIFFKE